MEDRASGIQERVCLSEAAFGGVIRVERQNSLLVEEAPTADAA